MKRRCPVCHTMRPSYLFDSHVRQCRKAARPVRINQRVIVNTGGEDAPGLVVWARDPNRNPALADAVCVSFGTGTNPQWIPRQYIREASE